MRRPRVPGGTFKVRHERIEMEIGYPRVDCRDGGSPRGKAASPTSRRAPRIPRRWRPSA